MTHVILHSDHQKYVMVALWKEGVNSNGQQFQQDQQNEQSP